MWSFNFAEEEKKRFRGELMWNPNILKQTIVDDYLKAVVLIWPKCTGMNEEIALKFLVKNNYKVDLALNKMKVRETSYDIVRLINSMTQHDSKIEFLGYSIKLQELAKSD
jgi:hypothetical protein